MLLTLNGLPHDAPDGCTLTDLVAGLTPDPRGTAAALNGTVVRTADWAATAVHAGDRVEVVTASQGG